LAATGRASSAAEPAARPAVAPHPLAAVSSSGFRHSVCRWCYKQIPLDDLARAAQGMGIESVELLDPVDFPVVHKYGLTCAMANGTMTILDGLNRPENHATLVPSMIERIKVCADAGIPNVICFSGLRRGMDDQLGLENCARGLKQIVGTAEKQGVTVCMELLNSKVTWGVELVRRVGSERFKLLFDIYHMQIMDGDIIRTLTDHREAIGHFHTAGVPGRNEINATQELNYPAIMRAIKATGFRGFVAQEFIPLGDPLTSLRAAIQLCTV
jgi:hydroxypyruvate isomerase